MFLHSPLRRSGLFVPAVTCIGILCLFLQSTSLPSTFSSSSSVQFYKNDTASINNLVTEVDVRHNHQHDQSGMLPREEKDIQTSEKQKPFFFWHIGAHKTGSSSFQRFINEERENLKVDNYLVGHRCGTRYPCNGAGQLLQILLGEPSFLDCLTVWERHVHTAVNTTTTSTSLPSYEGEKIPTFHVNEDDYFSLEPIPCWRELFTRKLDRISSNNIIMMREAFSYALWMHLKPWGFKLVALELQRRWNTTIVVTHRRFAEWLVSCIYFRKAEHYHSQIQWKQKGMNFLIKNLYPFNFVEKTISDPFFHKKAGINGTKNIRLYWDGHPPTQPFLFPDESLPYWRAAGFNVFVVDMDVHPNQGVEFLCNVLQGSAPHACQESYKDEFPHLNVKNNKKYPSDMNAYISIVLYAFKQGLLNSTHSHHKDLLAKYPKPMDLATHLRKYVVGLPKPKDSSSSALSMSWTDLPLHCPTKDEMNWLLEISLEKEQELVPHYSPNRSLHVENFVRKVSDSKMLCGIDLQALFHPKGSEVSSWKGLLDRIASFQE